MIYVFLTEKSSINVYSIRDPALLKTLGDYIKYTQLQQHTAQQQLGVAAGVIPPPLGPAPLKPPNQ